MPVNVPLMSPKKKTPVFLLYTCDDWKSHISLTLRVVFKTLNRAEKAKIILEQNDIIDNADRNTHIVETHLGEFYSDGTYII